MAQHRRRISCVRSGDKSNIVAATPSRPNAAYREVLTFGGMVVPQLRAIFCF
jgi:hypothetical protein